MPDEKPDASRRMLIGGIPAGLAAAAITTSASAQDAPGGQPAAPPLMQDPVSQFPAPPFPKQTQEWPGLAARMDPRPDHGENSYKGSGRLAGRKALVTGGDSGMGRAAVIAFAREGADVAFNYLEAEEEDAREVVELIEAAGRKAFPMPGDLRDEAFCVKLVNDAASALGGLDILVNNAAFQRPHEALEEITTEQFDQTFKTNVYAMFWLTKAALAHLRPGSSIITTSSVQGYDPSETLVDYAMTKACNVSFTKSLAKQLAPKGIRVNSVAPGPIWTPLQPSGGAFPDKLPEFGADSPLGRPGQPGELAGLYVLLASQEGSYSTGQVFGAVGGSGGP
ncbi:MAG: NAD(P)-dependent oxidoreductase [Mesorhizobium amorphae]|nr:MAG: NAD(P)-dependent oxidoreductase [Mesorhizobium amorphae]